MRKAQKAMSNQFLRSLKLTNFLSFGPDSKEIELTPLNVLIGPNASGKSNFVEAIELLHATPTNLAEAIRIGGTAEEWLWKGASPAQPATITARLWSTTTALEYFIVWHSPKPVGGSRLLTKPSKAGRGGTWWVISSFAEMVVAACLGASPS